MLTLMRQSVTWKRWNSHLSPKEVDQTYKSKVKLFKIMFVRKTLRFFILRARQCCPTGNIFLVKNKRAQRALERSPESEDL